MPKAARVIAVALIAFAAGAAAMRLAQPTAADVVAKAILRGAEFSTGY